MTFSYSWSVTGVQLSFGNIVSFVYWDCVATNSTDSQSTILSGSTWFDPTAVLNNTPDPITGVRNPFVAYEDLTDADIVGWLEDVHATPDRAIALQRLAEVQLYGDADDAVYTPPARDEHGMQIIGAGDGQ